MTREEALKYFGTQVALAKAIGVNQSTVSLWRRGIIPLEHQMYLEKITEGALKADPHPAELKAAAAKAVKLADKLADKHKKKDKKKDKKNKGNGKLR